MRHSQPRRKQRRPRASSRGRQPKPRLSQRTAEDALARFGAMCATGCGRLAHHWHHVFDQQHFPDLADEVDNIVPLCDVCHGNHHSRAKPLARRVAKYAERLAVTPRMQAYLDRVYADSPPIRPL